MSHFDTKPTCLHLRDFILSRAHPAPTHRSDHITSLAPTGFIAIAEWFSSLVGRRWWSCSWTTPACLLCSNHQSMSHCHRASGITWPWLMNELTAIILKIHLKDHCIANTVIVKMNKLLCNEAVMMPQLSEDRWAQLRLMLRSHTLPGYRSLLVQSNYLNPFNY